MIYSKYVQTRGRFRKGLQIPIDGVMDLWSDDLTDLRTEGLTDGRTIWRTDGMKVWRTDGRINIEADMFYDLQKEPLKIRGKLFLKIR